MKTLADALPEEIDRIRAIKEFIQAGSTAEIEPADNGEVIQILEREISNAIRIAASGDVVDMVRCFQRLKSIPGPRVEANA